MIPSELPEKAGAALPPTQGDAFDIWLVDVNGHIAVSTFGLALVAGINRLAVPTFGSTEHAMAWGSCLDVGEHAALVDMQRSASNAALDERDPQRMVNLATRSQLLREAADAFVPTFAGALPRGAKGSG